LTFSALDRTPNSQGLQFLTVNTNTGEVSVRLPLEDDNQDTELYTVSYKR